MNYRVSSFAFILFQGLAVNCGAVSVSERIELIEKTVLDKAFEIQSINNLCQKSDFIVSLSQKYQRAEGDSAIDIKSKSLEKGLGFLDPFYRQYLDELRLLVFEQSEVCGFGELERLFAEELVVRDFVASDLGDSSLSDFNNHWLSEQKRAWKDIRESLRILDSTVLVNGDQLNLLSDSIRDHESHLSETELSLYQRQYSYITAIFGKMVSLFDFKPLSENELIILREVLLSKNYANA